MAGGVGKVGLNAAKGVGRLVLTRPGVKDSWAQRGGGCKVDGQIGRY